MRSARAQLGHMGRIGGVCRRGVWLAALLLLTAHAGRTALRGQAEGDVRFLEIDGVINPLTARYLAREVQAAADAGSRLVIVRLDTPGGLESSMREMTETILGSPVPLVVYVAPPGARAASAGMFLTIAAHVAAMAPGTNIGAAHPVGIGGAQTDTVMAGKLVNDAAALGRAIAETRGRNAEWVEQAVRQSVSITSNEALEENVIDLVARDLDELLRLLDGRTIATPAGEVTLRTAGASIVESPMRLTERILHAITDPNIAYILFTLGVVGLMAELYNPGTLFAGLTGVIALVLAFTAFGSLPIGWAGVLLLLVALGLLLAELYTDGVGILATMGIIAFVLGSLMLYTPVRPVSPAMPDVGVSPWVIVVMAITIGGFFALVLRAIGRARRAPVATGAQALVGRTGIATSDLTPGGKVSLDSEVWSAVADVGTIAAGERVEIVAVEGVTLRVKRG